MVVLHDADHLCGATSWYRRSPSTYGVFAYLEGPQRSQPGSECESSLNDKIRVSLLSISKAMNKTSRNFPRQRSSRYFLLSYIPCRRWCILAQASHCAMCASHSSPKTETKQYSGAIQCSPFSGMGSRSSE